MNFFPSRFMPLITAAGEWNTWPRLAIEAILYFCEFEIFLTLPLGPTRTGQSNGFALDSCNSADCSIAKARLKRIHQNKNCAAMSVMPMSHRSSRRNLIGTLTPTEEICKCYAYVPHTGPYSILPSTHRIFPYYQKYYWRGRGGGVGGSLMWDRNFWYSIDAHLLDASFRMLHNLSVQHIMTALVVSY